MELSNQIGFVSQSLTGFVDLNRNRLIFFSVATLGTLVLLNQIAGSELIADWSNLLALSAGYLIGVFDIQSVISERFIVNPDNGHFVMVDAACAGLEACALVSLFCLVCLRISLYKKLWMALALSLLLQAINVTRIAHLYYLKSYHPLLFDVFHWYFWQVLNFMVILFICLKLGPAKHKPILKRLKLPPKNLGKLSLILALLSIQACGGGGGGGGVPSSVPYLHPICLLLVVYWVVFRGRRFSS